MNPLVSEYWTQKATSDSDVNLNQTQTMKDTSFTNRSTKEPT